MILPYFFIIPSSAAFLIDLSAAIKSTGCYSFQLLSQLFCSCFPLFAFVSDSNQTVI
jgi:hypothetical protein